MGTTKDGHGPQNNIKNSDLLFPDDEALYLLGPNNPSD